MAVPKHGVEDTQDLSVTENKGAIIWCSLDIHLILEEFELVNYKAHMVLVYTMMSFVRIGVKTNYRIEKKLNGIRKKIKFCKA